MNTSKAMQIVVQDVARFLNISEEDIFWLQIELGGKFLEGWIGKECESQIDLMKKTPEFWAWWRQVWTNHDRIMLGSLGKLSALELQRNGTAWEYYVRFHRVENMYLKPNSVVMEGYHKMLKGITKKPVSAF